MENLPPIPIPPAQKWREFKMNRMPVIVYLMTLTAVIVIWNQSVGPRQFVGEAVTASAQITSPETGSLAELNVSEFQAVNAGDPVARIIVTSPEILSATLAVIQAEIDLLRSGISPDDDLRQSAMRFEQLRLDWLRQRVDLAGARVRLNRAESDVRRQQALNDSLVVSEDAVELAVAERDALKVEIEESTVLVQEIEQNLQTLRPYDFNANPSAGPTPLQAAIAVQEKNLQLAEAEMTPLTLRAPISGQINVIYRRVGEVVAAGEPILTISGTSATHIMTYLAQPLSLEPAVGMNVELRTRGINAVSAMSNVLNVGSQFQTMEALLGQTMPPLTKQLPVMIGIPAEVSFRPGELVDIRFLQ